MKPEDPRAQARFGKLHAPRKNNKRAWRTVLNEGRLAWDDRHAAHKARRKIVSVQMIQEQAPRPTRLVGRDLARAARQAATLGWRLETDASGRAVATCMREDAAPVGILLGCFEHLPAHRSYRLQIVADGTAGSVRRFHHATGSGTLLIVVEQRA